MRVQDFMSTDVETIAPSEPAYMANELMWRKNIHHLVVMDGNDIVGVISDSDLGGPKAENIPDDMTVADAMSRHVIKVEPTTTLREAANKIQGNAISSLPVLENDVLVGIITTTDLMRILGRSAPERAPIDETQPRPYRFTNGKSKTHHTEHPQSPSVYNAPGH